MTIGRVALPLLLMLSTPGSARPGPSGSSGTIAGRVELLSAETLAPRRVEVTRDPAVCGADRRDRSLLVDAAGGIENVAVIVEGVVAEPAPDPRARTLNLSHCDLVPRLQTAVVGDTLEITNLDPIAHQIQAFGRADETLFQLVLPLKNQTVRKRLKESGILRLSCSDGHAWASGWVVVEPHPHVAVTGHDGQFELVGVPTGTYAISTWHERLGTRRGRVKVEAGRTSSLRLVYELD